MEEECQECEALKRANAEIARLRLRLKELGQERLNRSKKYARI